MVYWLCTVCVNQAMYMLTIARTKMVNERPQQFSPAAAVIVGMVPKRCHLSSDYKTLQIQKSIKFNRYTWNTFANIVIQDNHKHTHTHKSVVIYRESTLSLKTESRQPDTSAVTDGTFTCHTDSSALHQRHKSRQIDDLCLPCWELMSS